MHPNSAFRPEQDDLAALLVREIGFAAIFAGTPDGPRVAHAPVILSEDATTLQFHLARGNGLTKHLAGAAALVVVQGPDAYVSANWYADQTKAVPTWNYVAVEMEGVPRQLDDAGLVAQLDALAALHEARAGEDPPWTRGKMDPACFGKLTGAILAFEMPITAWRPTIKLSQNKDADERARVADGIERTGHGALAHLMRELGGARKNA
ncbi:FMN-binding negative transcriptional regulator [Sphingopyxis sp. 113P3]|uniref:FMN-binding negative transcriptional regulator n=1 Tax=Sphingopyxis sp. (strain 113P3) TaxID=292913 RepID=UPI0006AD4525|nr:FMN-binding negative transcriptional regulator [Sphingopyxis sp. 113P3]ALC10605.1 negative transcriptional regulator [Sphingopyxis sp. 113P3]